MSKNPKAYYNDSEHYSSKPTGLSAPQGPGSPASSTSELSQNTQVPLPGVSSAVPTTPPPPYQVPFPGTNTANPRPYGSVHGHGWENAHNGPPGFKRMFAKAASYAPPFLAQGQPVPPGPTGGTATTAVASRPPHGCNPHLFPWSQANRQGEEEERRNQQQRGCSNFVKIIFVVFLFGILATKYRWFQAAVPAGNTGVCSQSRLTHWEPLPSSISVSQDVFVAVKGHVSGGKVRVRRSPQSKTGSIRTSVYIAPDALAEHLDYQLQVDKETRLTLLMSESPLGHRECIDVEMDIELPMTATSLTLDLNNLIVDVLSPLDGVDRVDISTSNAAITWADGSSWHGDSLRVETSNGHIYAMGALRSNTTLSVKTSNGGISLGDVSAVYQASVRNANGVINIESATSDDSVEIVTSNSRLEIKHLVASTAILETSNGPVIAPHVNTKVLTATSTNGRLDCGIVGVSDVMIKAATSNAPVRLQLTEAFDGNFDIRTSPFQRASVHDQHLGVIQYTVNKGHIKTGKRYKGKGDLTVTTSNAHASVLFNL